MTDIQRLADQGPVQKMLPCKYCRQHCYEIEVSLEGADCLKPQFVPYPEWVDTFRLWRTCRDDLDDDEYGEKDDHRTGWTHSMKLTISEWNGINQ